MVRIYNPNNDLIVISLMIAKHSIRRNIVDSGSFADLLFYDAFVTINLPLNELKLIFMPVVGFNRESIGVNGEITLPIMAGISP